MEDHQKHDLGMRVTALEMALRTNGEPHDRYNIQKTAQQYYLFLKRSTRIKKAKQ